MITAYFDTNVYDQVDKRGIAPEALIGLGRALGRGGLQVLLSETILEELAAAVGSDPDGAIRRIRLAANITCWREVGLTKDHSELLKESVHAIETGARPPDQLKFSDVVPRLLAELANPDASRRRAALEELRKQKTEFKVGNREAARKTREGYSHLLSVAPPPFEDFWRWMERQRLSALLGEIGERLLIVDASRSPAILVCAGIAASLVYAETVEGRAQQDGDSRDMHHAVLATTAEVFVTHDREFARRLRRIPALPYRVMSLPELVCLLDS